MRPKSLVVALGVGTLASLTFAPLANASAKEQTHTTFVDSTITGGGDTGEPLAQSVVGNVSPGDHAGEKVTVKYSRKNHGDWTVLGSKRAKLDSNGIFSTYFTHPATRGTCQLIARYAGDAHSTKSHDVRVVDCATGQPQA